MALLRALDRLVRGLTSAAVSVSAVLILAIAVIVTVDVASAFLLNSPIPIVSELSSATLAVIIFGALAYAQYRQQNVKVDLVLALLSRRTRNVLDGVGLLISAAMLLLLAMRSTAHAAVSVQTLETAMALIAFPVYPFKIAVATCAWISVAEFLRQFVRLVANVAEEPVREELPPAAKL
jgi:TRAP-type C4-dicarboxylate transport system permease small subunit